MTGREDLSRKIRRGRLLLRLGYVVVWSSFFAQSVLGISLPRNCPLLFPSTFLAAVVLCFAGRSVVRCPWCRGLLGLLHSQSIDAARERYCPHCLRLFDSTLNADGKPRKGWTKKPDSWEDELAR
jgi:hypothetical protein